MDRTGAVDAHEVGCGEGELARRLAARGLRVRGTDASAEVIAEARARAEAAGVSAEFRVAAVEELEPAQDAAELILCCEVMEHLPDPEGALSVGWRIRVGSITDDQLQSGFSGRVLYNGPQVPHKVVEQQRADLVQVQAESKAIPISLQRSRKPLGHLTG